MKERMTEIGGRWQRLPLKEKDRYKKIAEEKQKLYKVQLEQWLAVFTTLFTPNVYFVNIFVWNLTIHTKCFPLQSLSSQERATYKEYNSLVSY